MYKIVENARAWAPVIWPGLTEEGEQVENRIEMRFKLADVDTFHALQTRAYVIETEAKAENPDCSLSEIYAKFIEELADNWRGVAGENGEALPWSTENIVRLMRVHGTADAVLQAYKGVMSGKAEIRRGN